MKKLLNQIRLDLAQPAEGPARLTYPIVAGVLLTPLALLGDGLADVVVSTTAALFLVRSLLRRDLSWVREPWIIAALVLWLYLVARGALSVNPERSGTTALVWVRFIVFGAAIQWTLSRSTGLKKALLYAIMAMAVFGAADALFQFVAGFDVFGRPIFGGRLTGPLQNPAIGMLLLLGGLPAITLFSDVDLANWQRGSKALYLPLGLLALIYVAILLSGERMAFIQAMGMLALLVIILFRPPLRLLAGVGFAAVAFVAVLLAAFPHTRERHLSTLTHLSNAAASIYGKAMLSGIEVIKDHPLFGVGVKNFKAHCPAAVEDPSVAEACRLISTLHHVWLHILAETGLVGALGFLVVFVLALQPAVRLWPVWAHEPLLAGATISVLVRLLPITTSGNFFSNWREALFWFLLGTAAALGRILRSADECSGNRAAAVTRRAQRSCPMIGTATSASEQPASSRNTTAELRRPWNTRLACLMV